MYILELDEFVKRGGDEIDYDGYWASAQFLTGDDRYVSGKHSMTGRTWKIVRYRDGSIQQFIAPFHSLSPKELVAYLSDYRDVNIRADIRGGVEIYLNDGATIESDELRYDKVSELYGRNLVEKLLKIREHIDQSLVNLQVPF